LSFSLSFPIFLWYVITQIEYCDKSQKKKSSVTLKRSANSQAEESDSKDYTKTQKINKIKEPFFHPFEKEQERKRGLAQSQVSKFI